MENQPIVIIDLARTYADNLEQIYIIIENLKNGMYLNTKYETIQKIFKIPNIIVMANFKPDLNKLSGKPGCQGGKPLCKQAKRVRPEGVCGVIPMEIDGT
jgi:hypothetical protein